MIIMIDKEDVYNEMVEKYDDDHILGDIIADAIANVFENCDHGMQDKIIMNRFCEYIRDVFIQSVWDYIERNKKEIVTDILGYCKE